MKNECIPRESKKSDTKITLPLINQIIENLSNKDTNSEGIILPKLNQILDSVFNNDKVKKFFNKKFLKMIKFFKKNKNKITTAKSNNFIRKEIIMSKALLHCSIYILRDLINNAKHKYIQEYLKILLFFMLNDILSIDNFILIINIFLDCIINIMDDIDDNNIKLFKLKEEPLLFINDIIEVILNSYIKCIDNYFFVEVKKRNIVIEHDEK